MPTIRQLLISKSTVGEASTIRQHIASTAPQLAYTEASLNTEISAEALIPDSVSAPILSLADINPNITGESQPLTDTISTNALVQESITPPIVSQISLNEPISVSTSIETDQSLTAIIAPQSLGILVDSEIDKQITASAVLSPCE